MAVAQSERNGSMDDVVRILLIWLLCLLSVLLHELGHALGYRITGEKAEWKIRAGSGPEIFSTAKFTFCLLPVGGYFDPREELLTKKAKLWTLAGGPLVTLLLAALFYACCLCFFGFLPQENALYEVLLPVSRFLMIFNFFLFLFTGNRLPY